MREGRPNGAFRLSYDDGLLVLSAGADRLYGLDSLDEVTALELLAAWASESFDLERLSPLARVAAEELIEAGALDLGERVDAATSVCVRWVGDPDERLEAHLGAGLDESAELRVTEDDADLMLVVRTTGRLVEIHGAGIALPSPHLLLDVAYHHTVSIGPLVVTDETACLACLAGRVGSLWGDPEPPPRPALLESPALAAALAVRALERTAAGDVSLVNATAAYDLDAHCVTVGAVYKLPWCPVCGDGGQVEGRIELPWSTVS